MARLHQFCRIAGKLAAALEGGHPLHAALRAV